MKETSIKSSIIVMFFMLGMLCFTFVGCGTKTDNNVKASKKVINLANDTVKSLQENLKKPSTLHINSIIVSEIYGQSTVLGQNSDVSNSNEEAFTYTIYIEYSAENSIGQNTKSYFSSTYYLCGENVLTLENPHEISSIPKITGTVYQISADELESYSDTLK